LCPIDKKQISWPKPDKIPWLQVYSGLMTDHQRIIKKNTYVCGKIGYIWLDFEKGLNKICQVRENGSNKGNGQTKNQSYNRNTQKRCAIIMHINNC
jgi:hypothetical protein